MITQDELYENLLYNPRTGIFYHKIRKPGVCEIMDIAGSNSVYCKIVINRMSYKAHHLAFLYMEGYLPERVDHIDHNPLNNIWSNLREATQAENCKNMSKSKLNTSGTTGVYFMKDRNKWRVRIGVTLGKGKYTAKHIGVYDTKEEAILARESANIEYNYHDNHGQKKVA